MKVSLDRWDGVEMDTIDFVHPTPEQVIDLFRKLDQKTHTTLCVKLSDKKWLMVGGGVGQYVVTGNTEEDRILELRLDRPDNPTVSMFIGGQEGDFEPGLVVDARTAVEAIFAFLKNETFAAQFPWRDIDAR